MLICSICINNDVLCNACNKKLQNNEVTQAYIDVARFLHNSGFNDNFNIIESNDIIAIIANKDVSKIIGKNGRNVKKIEELTGKRIKILEKKDEKGTIENILGVSVLGLNVIYSDGEEKKKIKIDKRFASRINDDKKKLLFSITGKNYIISFE